MSKKKETRPTFMGEMFAAMKEGPRLYFAPLVGAYRAVKDELKRIDEQRLLRR